MSGLRCAVAFAFGLGGALLLLVGLALVLAPQPTLRALSAVAHRGPVARALRWLDQQRFIERFVYRHHRLFGAAITLGALYSSYRLLNPVVPTASSVRGELILLTAVRFLWLANTAIIVIGLVIFLRPSLLKGLEQWSNRRIALETPASGAGTVRWRDWMRAAPRTSGMILATAGSYLASLMLIG